MKTVILGCGYIGGALLAEIDRKERVVVATTRHEERRQELSRVADEVVVLQAEDQVALAKLLKEAEQVIVTIAVDRGGSYKEAYLDTAKAVAGCLGPHMRHLIYTSSTSVYGDARGDWVTEETPLAPLDKNAEILCEAEKIYLALPIKATILRLAGIYGPGRTHEKRAYDLYAATFHGEASSFCNWVHKEDIVRAILWVLNNGLEGIYNVCSNEHPTRAVFYGSLFRELGLGKVEWDTTKGRFGNKRVASEKLKETGFTYLHGCRENHSL
ncbi:MAG: NAD-dependent epimerase/dehydratase family protein [Chlamydiales bacterium]